MVSVWDGGGCCSTGSQVSRIWIPVAPQEGPQRSPCSQRFLVPEAGLWCQEEAITPHLSFPTMSLFHHFWVFSLLF